MSSLRRCHQAVSRDDRTKCPDRSTSPLSTTLENEAIAPVCAVQSALGRTTLAPSHWTAYQADTCRASEIGGKAAPLGDERTGAR